MPLMNAYEEALSERVNFVLLQFLMPVAQAKVNEQLECTGSAFLLLLEIYVSIADSKLRQISYIDYKFNSKPLYSHY